MLENLFLGFSNVLSPTVLIGLTGGTIIGYLIGAMPGLGPSLGVALLIPFTYGVDPATAIVALIALYVAAEYGGAVTAVVINTPGTAAAVATTWDGYPLAQRGQAGAALNVSIIASGIGALLAAVMLMFTAVPLSEFALRFGPTEYFALALFGLSLVSSLSAGSLLKGLFAMFLGLTLVTIGVDPGTGIPRFAFSPELFEGLPLVPCLLGLYAISEVFYMIETASERPVTSVRVQGLLAVPVRTYWEMKSTILKSSLIGYIIGVIPGAGASIASMVAYSEAKRSSQDPDSFGKGNLHGIAASESANNSAVPGALAPLLALGIPGSATAAILIGALMIQGIEPGPLLFTRNPEIPYTIFASLIVSVPLMIFVGLAGAKLWARVADVPKPLLAAVVAGISCIGAYASANSMFPVYVMLAMGAIGYALRKIEVPLAPIVLALVLGTIMETNFRRALLTSNGDYMIFLRHPITLLLFAFAAVIMLWPLVSRLRATRCAPSKEASQ